MRLVSNTFKEEHLVAAVGLAAGVAIGTISVRQAIDALRTRSMLGGGLLIACHTIGWGAIGSVIIDNRLAGSVLCDLSFDWLVVDGVTGVRSVNTGLETLTLARVRLHDLLVLTESRVELVNLNIVQEYTFAQRAWDGGAKFSITGLERIVSTC